MINILSPELASTFMSDSKDSLHLEAILIKTFQFNVYPGGGFCGESYWKDLVLSHRFGSKKYELKNLFSFLKIDTLNLRFFTDYFFRNVGSAPIGNYLIQIQFVFLRNGKKETASTEIFKMDA
jgi:hypothetical protein